MKAISVRQPRAEQIVRGEKTMDVRSWSVSYRGVIAIHASGTRRAGRIRALGFAPDALDFGALIGTAELIDIVPLDADTYEATRDQHLSDTPFPGAPCFGWRFANPVRLSAPVLFGGSTRLMNIPPNLLPEGEQAAFRAKAENADEKVGIQSARGIETRPVNGSTTPNSTINRVRMRKSHTTIPPVSSQSHTPVYLANLPHPDPARPFVLYSVPDLTAPGSYRVALYQWLTREEPTNGTSARHPAPGAIWEIEVGGFTLQSCADFVIAALRANGYKPTQLSNTPNTPFYLDERHGVRLALLFVAVKPLSRWDRVEAIQYGIQEMTEEEATYWYSKCTAGSHPSRAQKALRVLLTDD